MPSEATRAFSGAAPWRTTLGAVVHQYAGNLLAVFAFTTIGVTAGFVLTGFDIQTLVPPSIGPVAVGPVTDQVAYNRLAVEIALLTALVTSSLYAAPILARHDRVEFRRARTSFAVAAACLVVGVLVGRLVVLPLSFELFAEHLVDVDAAVGPYWLTELALFFPVGLGVAFAFPALLVGAVRAGLLPRFTTARHRTCAVIPFVLFSATHAPPTANTFVLYAAPLLVGLGVGVAYLEFADSNSARRHGVE